MSVAGKTFSQFTLFLRPRFVKVVVLTGSDRRIKALPMASPKGNQPWPSLLLSRSFRVLLESQSPNRPTSSSINNARNLSRLSVNPCVHPFSLPSDTSRSYRDSTQPTQQRRRRSTRPRSSNPLLASSNSLDATSICFLYPSSIRTHA